MINKTVVSIHLMGGLYASTKVFFVQQLPQDWFGEKADLNQRATETKKAVPSPVQGKQAHGSNSNIGYGFLCRIPSYPQMQGTVSY